MLSAIAVGVSGEPGPGFYELARELGLLKQGEEELEFGRSQREAVYQAWKGPLPRE